MAELESISKIKDILLTLAALHQGAYRLKPPRGHVVTGGNAAKLCDRMRERHGQDYCDHHCFLAERCKDTRAISTCQSGVSQFVVPLNIGSNYLGHLFFGDFRTGDFDLPDATDEKWQAVLQSGVSIETLRGEYEELRIVSPELHEQQMESLQRLLDNYLDNLLERRISDVKAQIVDSETVPREKLWLRLEEEVRNIIDTLSIEIFTISPARDSVTCEPRMNSSQALHRYEEFQCAEKYGYGWDGSKRLILLLRYETQSLGAIRLTIDVGTQEKLSIPNSTEIKRLCRLANAIAEALDLRRHQRAEKILSSLERELMVTQDHRANLKILLQKCLQELNCDHGEILLRTPSEKQWLRVVVRVGTEDQQLPSRVTAEAGLSALIIKNPQTIVIIDTAQDDRFDAKLEAESSKKLYPDKITQNHYQYLRAIAATVQIPLKVGNKVEGILCLHRKAPGNFYLGMVRVIELIAGRIVLELAYVLMAEEYSARARQYESMKPPRDALLETVKDLDSNKARKTLYKQLTDEALKIGKGFRAAVAVISENWTKVSVIAATKNWPNDPFEYEIELKTESSGVVEAIRRGQNYIIHDTQDSNVRFLQLNELAQIRSSVQIRLQCGPNLLGILIVEWLEPNAFGDVEVQGLTQLADRYADVMHTFDINSLMLKLESFLRNDWRDETPSYQTFLQQAAEMIGVGEGSLFIRNRDSGLYELRAHLTNPDLVLKAGQHYEIDEGLTGWVIRKNRPLYLRNVLDQKERDRVAPGARWLDKIRDGVFDDEKRPDTSLLAVPIMVGNEVFGVLRFNVATNWRPFDIEDAGRASTIASLLAAKLLENDRTNRNRAEMTLLQAIRENSDKRSFAKQVFETIRSGVGSCGCHIRLRDKIQHGRSESRDVLMLIAQQEPPWLDDNARQVWTSPSLFHDATEDAAGYVWTNHKSFYDKDVKADGSPCALVNTPAWFRANVGTVIVVPLSVNDEFIGTLHVYKERKSGLTPAERSFVKNIASVAAAGIVTIDEKDSSQLEIALRSSADDFFLNLIVTSEMESHRAKLYAALLKQLSDALRANCGWILRSDLSGRLFYLQDRDGNSVANATSLDAELVKNTLDPNGLRVTIGLDEFADIANWIRSWLKPENKAEEVIQFAKNHQACLLALQSDQETLAIFCLLFDKVHGVSYHKARQTNRVLRTIATEVAMAINHVIEREDQRRFEQISLPFSVIGAQASSVEHNLRRPVNSLLKALEYLTTKPRDPKKVNTKLFYIRDHVKALDADVAKLVLLAGVFKAECIAGIFQKAVAACQRRDSLSVLHIGQTPPPETVMVNALEQPLCSAFGFILSNAMEAVAFKGMDGRVNAEISYDEQWIQIAITDNGRGMSKDAIDKAVIPYTSSKGPKRGLGLPAAMVVVRHHQGRLKIDSAEDFGTKMVISLPRCKREKDN